MSASERPRRSGSALIAAGIALSRLFGLIRESVFSAFIGLGAAADALAAATRIPNVLQNLLGEGALSAAFIPVYSAELDRDEEEAGKIAGAVAAILALIAAITVVIGVLAARPITQVLAWGFRDDDRLDLAVSLVRITFPAAGLLVLSAWCLGILNSHRRFFLSYVAPVLWNIAQIGAVTIAALVFDVDDLDDLARAAAYGFLIGSALQFLVQVPNVRRLARGLRFQLDTNRPGVREVRRRFGGALLGRGVLQISGYIDTLLASLLVAGAVGALVKAQVLYLMPIALFAISVAAAELPELSRLRSHDEISARAQKGFARIAFFISFIALAYITLGDLIIGTLFERREFSSDDTITVWFVLLAYALGLPASALSRLTQNTLWSQGDTSGPARIAFLRMVVSAVVAILIMGWFDGFTPDDARDLAPATSAPATTDPDLRLGAMGIALAASVAGWTEAIVLGRLAASAVSGVAPLEPLRRLLPAIAGAAFVALALRFVVQDLWTPLAAVIAVGGSGLAYLAGAWALRIDELDLVLVGPLSRYRRRS